MQDIYKNSYLVEEIGNVEDLIQHACDQEQPIIELILKLYDTGQFDFQQIFTTIAVIRGLIGINRELVRHAVGPDDPILASTVISNTAYKMKYTIDDLRQYAAGVTPVGEKLSKK